MQKYVDNRDWKETNEKYVRRGEFYFSVKFLEEWDDELEKMNDGKVGKPFQFPEAYIQFFYFLRTIFHVPFRQMEGLSRGLNKINPLFKIVDYSTIAKRKIIMDLPEDYSEEMTIAIDSSGMKVTNRGEWIREKWKVRRGWIKVHIAVDVKSKKLVGLEITDERTGDGKMLRSLVGQAEKHGKITRIVGDGAYDTRDNFNLLREKEIEPVIKVRNNATTRSRGSPARARVVKEFRRLGYEGWKTKWCYGQRWACESIFSAVKRIFGESVLSTSVEGIFNEIQMKFVFYDMISRM